MTLKEIHDDMEKILAEDYSAMKKCVYVCVWWGAEFKGSGS